MVSREIRCNLDKIMTPGCMPAAERLGRFVRELIFEEDPDELQKNGKLELPLRSCERAEIVAVTPQHLYRILKNPELRRHLKQSRKIRTVRDPLVFMHEESTQS